MNAKEKIQAIVKEKADHEQTLEGLQAALDAAADVGDLAEVKRVQTEMAAVQELVASCERRAKALQAALITEQKAAQREANDAALDKVKGAYKRLPPHARKIEQLVAALGEELKTFHKVARDAADGAFILIKQADTVRPHDYLSLAACTAFNDNVLGHFLGDELRKAGIFTRLAPHSSVRFPRLDLPPLSEGIDYRIENLTKRVEHAHSVANESLK